MYFKNVCIINSFILIAAEFLAFLRTFPHGDYKNITLVYFIPSLYYFHFYIYRFNLLEIFQKKKSDIVI